MGEPYYMETVRRLQKYVNRLKLKNEELEAVIVHLKATRDRLRKEAMSKSDFVQKVQSGAIARAARLMLDDGGEAPEVVADFKFLMELSERVLAGRGFEDPVEHPDQTEMF